MRKYTLKETFLSVIVGAAIGIPIALYAIGAHMPRISSKKKEYKISDLTKYIRNEMYSQGIQQKEMAEKLDISQPQLSHKLKNNVLSYKDLLIIFSYLKTDDEEILKIMKL